MVFSKAGLESAQKGLNKITQRAASIVVDYGETNSIGVHVSSNFDGEWTTAVNGAISNWNNINETQLYLVYWRTVDISIRPDTDTELPSDMRNLSSTTAGSAKVPEYGMPGPYVSLMDNVLTDDPNYIVRINQKTLVATHELGHAVGFLHTDQPGSLIPKTPTSDASSVMNSGTDPTPEWSGFSSYDELATKVLYPNSLAIPTITSTQVQYPIGIAALIKLWYSTENKAAYVEVWRKKDSEEWQLLNGSYTDYSFYLQTVTRTSSVQVLSYKIRVKNFKGDYITGYSNIKTVYIASL